MTVASLDCRRLVITVFARCAVNGAASSFGAESTGGPERSTIALV